MRKLRLWLLNSFEQSLAAEVGDLEESLVSTRRLLVVKHRQLRQLRARIAQLTPAGQLVQEMLDGREQRGFPLASRQRNVYRWR